MANIFFGIHTEEYARANIQDWIDIAGEPVLFSERDDHWGKYPGKFLGKYDVVSIDEALRRYPDAIFWVTFAVVSYVPDLLAKKMPPDRIRFLMADWEYRKGCRFLGSFMLYGDARFAPCCMQGKPTTRGWGDLPNRFRQWKTYSTKLIEAVQVDSPNRCQRCHLLTEGFWKKTVELSTLSFATAHKGDVCNFKCVYCVDDANVQRLKTDERGFSVYEVLQQAAKMPELCADSFTVHLSNGEITANKHCDDILDIVLEKKWKLLLTSNCSIYREKLARIMAEGRVISITTSIDAGTRESFKKIRQVDMFDQVIDNLRRYPTEKTNLYLKYIFLEGLNDNEADIDGFYEIVKELGGVMMFSSDRGKPFTSKMRELALKLVARAKADGIKIDPGGNFMHPDDINYIKESYARA